MAQCRPEQEIHIILDNLSAHKTQGVPDSLEQHPQVRLHFTPSYSSWLNQVEIWFAKIEREVIARGVFSSAPDLARKLRSYINASSANAQPIRWKYSDVTRRIVVTIWLRQATSFGKIGRSSAVAVPRLYSRAVCSLSVLPYRKHATFPTCGLPALVKMTHPRALPGKPDHTPCPNFRLAPQPHGIQRARSDTHLYAQPAIREEIRKRGSGPNPALVSPRPTTTIRYGWASYV